jgi:hypothetical protein
VAPSSTIAGSEPDERVAFPTAPPQRDTLVSVLANTPVYLLPDRNRTPLRVLERGAPVRFLDAAGAWYRVSFKDPQWGTRYGYVEAQRVDANSIAADLSVRKPLGGQQPLDLSVPPRRTRPQTPVDLSVARPAAAVTGTSNLEPVDMSVLPKKNEPVDLSVPRLQEPVDLSVPSKNR